MDHARRLERFARTDLYVVITEEFCAGRRPVDVLEAVLRAGVGVVQLREKGRDDRDLVELARTFRQRTLEARALLVIDDRVDVALAVDADGVHLGQRDLPVEAARAIAPDLIVGASTHAPDQIVAARRAGASYVNVGPIFPTRTKAVASGALGVEMIDRAAAQLDGVEWTVMGGITAENVDLVLARGARHVAVVTAVTRADDVDAAATRLRQKIAAARR